MKIWCVWCCSCFWRYTKINSYLENYEISWSKDCLKQKSTPRNGNQVSPRLCYSNFRPNREDGPHCFAQHTISLTLCDIVRSFNTMQASPSRPSCSILCSRVAQPMLSSSAVCRLQQSSPDTPQQVMSPRQAQGRLCLDVPWHVSKYQPAAKCEPMRLRRGGGAGPPARL